MLKRLNKKSGNRYTIVSIILIILMLYFSKFATGGSEVSYPQRVEYEGYKYNYTQTVQESSLKFVRKYGMKYEGHVLLLKRGENKEPAPEKVYIYTGWRKYREYKLVQ